MKRTSNFADLAAPFNLAPEPNITSVRSGWATEWLRFSSNEVLSLARFCYRQGNDSPFLVTYCERGDKKGPFIYEGYRISGVVLNHEGAAIQFYGGRRDPTFQLKLIAGKNSDPSGKVISYIDVMPEYFPMQQYLDFREQLISKQCQTCSRQGKPASPQP